MASLWKLMERRYDVAQGWLLFREVRSKTGYGAGPEGYCDAMAMSIWPSRGINLHGFEFKASRSDLLAELKQPAKADPFIKFCDFWWLVVDKPEFIEGLEIPPTWGILTPKTAALRAIRDAPRLEPQPWSRNFIASMLRRFHEAHMQKDTNAERVEIDRLAREQANKHIANHAATVEAQLKQLKDSLASERETIRRFELASGLNLARYNLGNIASAVRLIQHGSMEGMAERLRAVEKAAADLGDAARFATKAVLAMGERDGKDD